MFCQDGYAAMREKMCLPKFGFENSTGCSSAHSALKLLKRLQEYEVYFMISCRYIFNLLNVAHILVLTDTLLDVLFQ